MLVLYSSGFQVQNSLHPVYFTSFTPATLLLAMFEAVSECVRLLWDHDQTPPPSPSLQGQSAPSTPSTQYQTASGTPRTLSRSSTRSSHTLGRTPPSTPRTPLPDPDDYLEHLRPRRQTRRPAYLPNTPTKAHRPPERVQKRGKPKAFRCPNCKCRITITPSGNPRSAYTPYVAPPPKPVPQVERPVEKLLGPDLRYNWLKRSRQ